MRKHAEKEKERVRKIAEAQDAKKNKVYDPELFEEATSDPYITFSIDPPSNPGCKIFRRCDRSLVGEISVAPFRELTRS